MEIFKVFGSIMVNNDEANKSISKTDEKAGGLGSKLGTVAKGAVVFGAALGGAAIAAAAGMFKMATSSAETTDRIDKLSQKIGMSRKGFQEMDFVASQSGMAIESLQVGFKTLRGAMEQAEVGKGKGAEAFRELGVSVTDSTGALRDQEDVFNEAVNALQGMEDGTEKAMLATKLFGKSGQEMMPLLNGAAGSMDEMRQQANELGLVLSDESVDAGVAFTDTMDQLQRSFQAAVAEIGVQFMPIITKFADFIIASMPTIQKVISTAFDIISKVIGMFVDSIGNVIDWIGKWGGENSKTFENIKKVITDILTNIVKFIKEQLAKIQKFWDENGEAIKKVTEVVFGAIKKYIDVLMPVIVTIIKTAWDIIKQVFDTATTIIMSNIKLFVGLFTGDFGKMKEAILELWKSLWDLIKVVVVGAWNILSAPFKSLWSNIEGWFTGLKGDAFKWGENMIQGFIDGITGMIRKVKETVGKVMDTVGDFIGFNSPTKEGPGRNIVKWGRNMVDGFMGGVDEEGKSVGGILTNLFGNVPTLGGLDVPSSANAGRILQGGQSNSYGPPQGNSVVVHQENHFHSVKSSPSEDARLQKRASQEAGMAFALGR